jgi:hypothetical protein
MLAVTDSMLSWTWVVEGSLIGLGECWNIQVNFFSYIYIYIRSTTTCFGHHHAVRYTEIIYS